MEAHIMSDRWDAQYKAGQGRFFPNEELCRFLGRTYGPVIKAPCSAMTAVEIGCGVGGNISALAMYGFFTYGLDSSLEALKVADEYLLTYYRQARTTKVHLLPYTAPQTTKLPANSVQLVIDVHTIQHLNEDDHVLMYKEALRILSRGGLFFSVHWSGSRKAQEKIFPDHAELFSSEIGNGNPVALQSIAGFTIDHYYHILRSYQEEDGIWMVSAAVKP